MGFEQLVGFKSRNYRIRPLTFGQFCDILLVHYKGVEIMRYYIKKVGEYVPSVNATTEDRIFEVAFENLTEGQKFFLDNDPMKETIKAYEEFFKDRPDVHLCTVLEVKGKKTNVFLAIQRHIIPWNFSDCTHRCASGEYIRTSIEVLEIVLDILKDTK